MRSERVTLQQVAAAAGVSPTTASFVLSGRKDGQRAASEATAARVTRAARELGYAPNAHARAMRTGRTDSLALALGDARDPWVGELAHVVSQHGVARGLSTLVLVDDSWHALLQGHQFDCSLVTGAEYGPGRQQLLELARQGQRMVVHSGEFEPEGFDVIRSTAVHAVGLAYERLRSRHDRVHFVGWEPLPGVRGRSDIFQEVALAAGDDPAECLLLAPTLADGLASAGDWLQGQRRPTAVIAQMGYLAISVQAAAMRLGIAVPDDLEIIALGDVPPASSLFGPVSHYAPDDSFNRMAAMVIDRALMTPDDLPWRLLDLAWEFQPGLTTRDPLIE
ncbi:LacI family DNA-binding transcriptional regulator [Aestuariimicrobium soli]|uniref:LacI family DNA-binding transcriptional regulator n=1 Tax=Aestuariimicrobium soli TaxID=2035834 RepID=UPI003EBD79F8